MLGSYHNAETFSYQDEVGQLVLQVCQVKMFFAETLYIIQFGQMQAVIERNWKQLASKLKLVNNR